MGAISPARDTNSSYIAWGHSSVVNPWGEVVATCEDEEAIIYADLGKCQSFMICHANRYNSTQVNLSSLVDREMNMT